MEKLAFKLTPDKIMVQLKSIDFLRPN